MERVMSIWDAYKLGRKVKSRWYQNEQNSRVVLAGIKQKLIDLIDILKPIDYVRYREFEFVFNAINHYQSSPKTVLDISSPKLIPLTVASCIPTAKVYATDILDAEVNVVKAAGSNLGITNVIGETKDARQLDYPDQMFDLVTSVSVFEHIAPEKNGEIPAVKELSRVMTSNGIAILTVPFSRSYFAEYRFGAVYERNSSQEQPIFFQRFYDYDLLMKNIVDASGLDILYLGFINERYFLKDPRKRISQYINSSHWQNLLFGLWFPILSKIFLSSPVPLEDSSKPYIACLVLKKVVA